MTKSHDHPRNPSEAYDPIQGVIINFTGDELTWELAAKQLRLFADQLEAQTLHAEGFSWQYGGDFTMDVLLPPLFPHGDYVDGEGNLVHVGQQDHIVSVNWAGKDGKREDFEDMHVSEWIQEHGKLRPAGATTEDGGEGKLRAVNDDDEK